MGLLDKIKKMFISEGQYVTAPVKYDVDVQNKKATNNVNTFKNGRKSRQAILRKIEWKDEPFDGTGVYTLQVYEYEGRLAVGVYANGEQIGNVPKEHTKFVVESINKIQSVSVKVYSGSKTKSGEQKSFGTEATLVLCE